MTFVNINTDSHDYNYRFRGDADIQKTMIAAAMTASASGQKLAAQVENGEIISLYLYGAGQ